MESEHPTEKESKLQASLYVVDADSTLFDHYQRLADQLSARLSLHSTGTDFLSLGDYQRPCCLLLDLSVDDNSGENVQVELIKRRKVFPVIVNTNYVDLEAAIRVMERGAMTVLQKPTPAEHLVQSVRAAIELDRKQFEFDRIHWEIESRIESLTDRQREILFQVVDGLPTKAIARKLDVSDRLVENERSEILKAFDAPSTPDVTLKIGQYRVLDAIRLRIDSGHKGLFRRMTRAARVDKAP